MYQFDERPRDIDVVHFESVGGAANNDTTAVSEPPGFQLRLQSLVHSSDICTSAYNPSFKHVAVSDKAGTVSLIDLSKPALLWLQVRPARRRQSGCCAGLAGAVTRGALLHVSAGPPLPAVNITFDWVGVPNTLAASTAALTPPTTSIMLPNLPTPSPARPP